MRSGTDRNRVRYRSLLWMSFFCCALEHCQRKCPPVTCAIQKKSSESAKKWTFFAATLRSSPLLISVLAISHPGSAFIYLPSENHYAPLFRRKRLASLKPFVKSSKKESDILSCRGCSARCRSLARCGNFRRNNEES